MKNWKDKVLGMFAIIGLMSLLMGNYSNPPATANYEFYDLNDTRGIVFNKVTGEIKYEEIREEALQSGVQEIKLTNWDGSSYNNSSHQKFFD